MTPSPASAAAAAPSCPAETAAVGEVVSTLRNAADWNAFLTFASHQHSGHASLKLLVWSRFRRQIRHSNRLGPHPVPVEEVTQLIDGITDLQARTQVQAAFAQAKTELPPLPCPPAGPPARTRRHRRKPAPAVSGQTTVVTSGGPLTFTVTIDWTQGRVRYQVDQIGVFILSPHSQGQVRLQYGDDGEDYWQRIGERARPNAPRVNRIPITGDAVINPEYAEPASSRWLVVRRPASHRHSTSVPQATKRRVAQTVYALLTHYQAHPELAQIQAARARHLAPRRLAVHQRRIDQLTEQIAGLQEELAVQQRAAATQQALIDQQPPGQQPAAAA